jgi:tRNA G18 (ribose-2'-O)-methylase SpoU
MPRKVRLHSANNDFQRADVLRRNRHKRQRYGQFFLEGVRPLNAALSHDWQIEAFYYSPEAGLSDWARDILAGSTADTHFEMPAALMQQLSAKMEASELVAIVRMPPDDLARIHPAANPLVVIFDRPSSPGNLGSLIRSCDALGADGLVLCGHGADLYDPETISASRGSIFSLPVVRVGGPSDFHSWLERLGTTVFGSDEDGTVDLWDARLDGGAVLLLGNEKWGLSAAFRELCDVIVRIPMEGTASSLNVACAGSILLYEAARQRRAA